MARRTSEGSYTIAAGEVGTFSVCPVSWKLKSIDRVAIINDGTGAEKGQDLHLRWSALVDEYLVLLTWVRYLAVLLCAALVIFIMLQPTRIPLSRVVELSYRNHALQLLFVAIATFVVIRSFGRAANRKREDSGFVPTEKTVSIDGSTILPAREYISSRQGLAGKPDGLILEDGVIVPIEAKPLAKKLRDRYVAQLLVYMRLVEEFENQRPPHGYLFLGPKHRRIKVANTDGKQRWIEDLLAEMRSVLSGAPAKPAPHPAKCSRCDVRHRCEYRADGKLSGHILENDRID